MISMQPNQGQHEVGAIALCPASEALTTKTVQNSTLLAVATAVALIQSPRRDHPG